MDTADQFTEPTDEPDETDLPESTEDETSHETDSTVQKPSARGQESFFDPSQIDALNVSEDVKAQLKATWKRMHGGYTKALQRSKGAQEAAELVNRFNTDADFAQQVLQTRAQQLGLTLGKPDAKAADSMTQGVKAPAELVEAMRGELPTEMQWMAPMLAKVFVLGQQQSSAPTNERLAQLEAERQAQRDQESSSAWEAAEAEMDEKYPLWREQEDDLVALANFITGDRLTHPKYGNKIELVFKLLNGDTMARGEVARRMSQGARNRITTGSTSRVNQDNTQELIKKAKTPQEKWKIAAQAAVEHLGLRS